MSTPETLPESPRPPEIQPRIEQPIVPETIQQLGVTTPPQVPDPIVGDNNQILVQPITVTPAVDTTHTLVVPAAVATNEQELQKGAQGPANLSVTWLDMFWLRQIGKAVSKGWSIIFGK